MANRVLRDRCKHDRYEEHDAWYDGIRSWPGCPGGREVTGLDAEFLGRAANGLERAVDGMHLDRKFCLEQVAVLRKAAAALEV